MTKCVESFSGRIGPVTQSTIACSRGQTLDMNHSVAVYVAVEEGLKFRMCAAIGTLRVADSVAHLRCGLVSPEVGIKVAKLLTSLSKK